MPRLLTQVMLRGEKVAKWAPEPYMLRRGGIEGRMLRELSSSGHLLQLLTRCKSRSNGESLALSEELLLEV